MEYNNHMHLKRHVAVVTELRPKGAHRCELVGPRYVPVGVTFSIRSGKRKKINALLSPLSFLLYLFSLR